MSENSQNATGTTSGGAASGGLIAFIAVTGLFFGWGFVTSLIDPLAAAVKSIFSLTLMQSQLSQSAWFIAYFLASLPAAAILAKLGSVRAILAALGIMILGCLVAPFAAKHDSYNLVLAGLFIIASGVTLLQVAANPLMAEIGDPKYSHLRLTLAQAFNSFGTVLGPLLGAHIMLQGGVFEAAKTDAAARALSLGNVQSAFLIVAGVFAVLALFVVVARKPIEAATKPVTFASPLSALSSKWAVMGAAAIFLYVGAEVSIGSLMTNFLHDQSVLGLDVAKAGSMVSIYWGGAMVGRFVGAALLAKFKAPKMLALYAAAATLLCLLAAFSGGPIAGYAALSVGFFNSIMFPVIFTITLERSSASSAATSGLLCMAIVGGAILPPLAGKVGDVMGLQHFLFVPAIAYGLIVLFAQSASKAKAVSEAGSVASGH